MSQWLWDELHDLFDTDDGSLPEIRVDFDDAGALLSACALLEQRARSVGPRSVLGPPGTVRDVAALIVAGEPGVEVFHVMFEGLEVDGVTLPELGVFVFPDQLALDYRMGLEWGPRTVGALFELLVEMTQPDTSAALSLEDEEFPEVKARFERAWQRWLTERAG